jgi:uncharacterized membrane protein YgcG
MRRLSTFIIVLVCVFIVGAIAWKAETGCISVEGIDEYELGVNVFGIVSTVHERSPSAMLKETKIHSGTAELVVYRIIDDMYNRPNGGSPYDDGEPILICAYGSARRYADYFESHDFSEGRANMQVRRAERQDKRAAKKYGINIGRAVIIREYTEKYGGDEVDNFETLRRAEIMEIIDRDSVTREAAQAVADIFTDRFTNGGNVQMVITDNYEPEPTEPTATTAPVATSKPSSSSSSGKRTSSGSSSSRRTSSGSSQSSSSGSDSAGTPKPTAAVATSEPKPTAAASEATPQPLAPVREAARPTANPVVSED